MGIRRKRVVEEESIEDGLKITWSGPKIDFVAVEDRGSLSERERDISQDSEEDVESYRETKERNQEANRWEIIEEVAVGGESLGKVG